MLAVDFSLEELAQQINTEHEGCQEAYRNSLFRARSAGEKLLQAKAKVGHGNWERWIVDNCQFAPTTARAYMRVARDWKVLEESAAIANLSFRDALGLLSQSDDEGEAIMEADIVEPISAPEAPKKSTAAKMDLHPGDRSRVSNPDNLYYGQEVEVIERQAGFYIGQTSEGNEFPFFPNELEEPVPGNRLPAQSSPGPKPLAPKKPSVEQLRSLLERVLPYADLPAELLHEVHQALGL